MHEQEREDEKVSKTRDAQDARDYIDDEDVLELLGGHARR